MDNIPLFSGILMYHYNKYIQNNNNLVNRFNNILILLNLFFMFPNKPTNCFSFTIYTFRYITNW